MPNSSNPHFSLSRGRVGKGTRPYHRGKQQRHRASAVRPIFPLRYSLYKFRKSAMSKPAQAAISGVAKAARTAVKPAFRATLTARNICCPDALLARIENRLLPISTTAQPDGRGLKRGRRTAYRTYHRRICTNPYSVSVLSGIEAACREKGFTLLWSVIPAMRSTGVALSRSAAQLPGGRDCGQRGGHA